VNNSTQLVYLLFTFIWLLLDEYAKILPMKILGIDPGLATIGFAIIEDGRLLDCGVIRTDVGLSLSERLVIIAADARKLLLEFCPDLAAIEQLFFVKNVTNGMMVSHARGVLLHAVAVEGIPLLEVSPKDVKLAVCGYGNASKEQIQHMVQRIFSLSEAVISDDTADAMAIAYWASLQKAAKNLVLETPRV